MWALDFTRNTDCNRVSLNRKDGKERCERKSQTPTLE